jgi:hypothetical protein
MSAQPAEPGPEHELIRPDDQVIHVGGQTAVIVGIAELRKLRALELHASPRDIEAAEIFAEYSQWVADGRRDGMSQEEFERLLGIGACR